MPLEQEVRLRYNLIIHSVLMQFAQASKQCEMCCEKLESFVTSSVVCGARMTSGDETVTDKNKRKLPVSIYFFAFIS